MNFVRDRIFGPLGFSGFYQVTNQVHVPVNFLTMCSCFLKQQYCFMQHWKTKNDKFDTKKIVK